MTPPFIRIQDIADILIMTFLLYQLYSWFRGTRAMQVLLGLGVVTLIFFATRFLGLYMTSWILQELGTVLIVLVIVVFQAEIRQALYRFSLLRHLFYGRLEVQQSHFQEIAETVFRLAAGRTGAILVFNRSETLNDLMLNGVRLDCEITPQIIEAIFADNTPLHDGAILIREGRIALASCHLPLSINPDLPQFLGTRHRAALGLSERTDAVVVVVSEERGDVSLAISGELRIINNREELIIALNEQLNPAPETPLTTLPRQLFSNMLPKTAILLVVITCWALITSRQGQITNVTAPVRLHGLPDGLVLTRNIPEDIDVQLKSLSSLTPTPEKFDIAADIDLSDIHEGQTTIRIKGSDFKLPSGMSMTAANPAVIKIVTEKKVRKSVPVRVVTRGEANRVMGGYRITSAPTTVDIEGPASQVARIDSIATEEIDASRLVTGKEYSKNLVPPLKKVAILRDEPVTITLTTDRDRR